MCTRTDTDASSKTYIRVSHRLPIREQCVRMGKVCDALTFAKRPPVTGSRVFKPATTFFFFFFLGRAPCA